MWSTPFSMRLNDKEQTLVHPCMGPNTTFSIRLLITNSGKTKVTVRDGASRPDGVADLIPGASMIVVVSDTSLKIRSDLEKGGAVEISMAV